MMGCNCGKSKAQQREQAVAAQKTAEAERAVKAQERRVVRDVKYKRLGLK